MIMVTLYDNEDLSAALLLFDCRSSRVCSTALWLLGEYSSTAEDVQAAVDVIKQALGPAPYLSVDGEHAIPGCEGCDMPCCAHGVMGMMSA